ncbi:MAG: hypothetical protein Q8L48_43595 [Archangium sp.]|nr:hypothetical protein [Archangium sp.]
MSATEKPSTGLSLLAAFLALGALPVGFVLFALQTGARGRRADARVVARRLSHGRWEGREDRAGAA